MKIELEIDIARALVQMIDTVNKRGAVNGEELLPVATMRKRLTDGIDAAESETTDNFE
jgi:hypothetical protein